MKKYTIRLLVTTILVLFTSIFAVIVSSKANAKDDTTGYIWIGDSRFEQMNYYMSIDNYSDNYVVTKEDGDYEWYINEGSKLVNNIIEENPHSNWVYIFNLGVRDLQNVDKYIKLYYKISDNATVYYVSINPVDDYRSGILLNDVEEFNREIIGTAKIRYIDAYHYLTKVSGYKFNHKNDGINYNIKTYEKLYEFLTMSIEVNEFMKNNDDRYSAGFYLFNHD